MRYYIIKFSYKNGFINNLYIFRSNEKLKKLGLNNVSCRLLKNIRLKNKIKVNLKGDSLYKAKLKKCLTELYIIREELKLSKKVKSMSQVVLL